MQVFFHQRRVLQKYVDMYHIGIRKWAFCNLVIIQYEMVLWMQVRGNGDNVFKKIIVC